MTDNGNPTVLSSVIAVEPYGPMGECPNPLAVTHELHQLEQVIADSAINPYLALLAAELRLHGGDVRPPLIAGGHTRVTLPDGTVLSLAAFMEWTRWHVLSVARCAICGEPTAIPPRRGPRLRGPRLDRRYCSNACRQRAYRQRKTSDDDA